MEKNGNGPDKKKVIDFREAHKKQAKQRGARKRNRWIAILIAAALFIGVGAFLFSQVNEVLNGKSFWQNFSSGAESAVLRIL